MVPDHHILRTTWVVGDGHNFVKTMKRLADMRIDPKVVDDQFGRLTFTSELVRYVDHILIHNIEPGTYNVTNSGKVRSWSDIAKLVFKYAGYEPDRAKSISTDEYKADKDHFAPRPEHSDMNLAKIYKTGFESKGYELLLQEYVKDLPVTE